MEREFVWEEAAAALELPVRFAETDAMGIVHHATYVIWCEAGRVSWIEAVGMPYAEVAAGGNHLAVTGLHLIDIDGPEPMPLIPVFCDMTLDGGGWTRVERSPLADPIARALFADVEVNYDDPTKSRYRMGRAAMNVVQQHSNELWFDCGGTDHLWTDSDFLFELSRRLGDADDWPRWREGSEFKARRDAMLQ